MKKSLDLSLMDVDTSNFLSNQTHDQSKMDVDGSVFKSKLPDSVSNKNFRDDIERYTSQERLFSDESLYNLFEKQSQKDQLQTNLPDSSSSDINLPNQDPLKFNKSMYKIGTNKLPIVDFAKPTDCPKSLKNPNKKRKAFDTSFVLASTSRNKYESQQARIKRFMVNRKVNSVAKNYKEISTDSEQFYEADELNDSNQNEGDKEQIVDKSNESNQNKEDNLTK